MAIRAMNHFTVLSDDLTATQAFYCDLLGLRSGPRPSLGFPGLWLYAGEQAILHVIGGRPLPEQRSGVIDHMAFTATDLGATVEALQQRGIRFSLRRVPKEGSWQLFCRDPGGALVELDFAADEPAPPGFAQEIAE